MTDNGMPEVLLMTVSDDGQTVDGDINFCELHEGEIRMALIQRGFAEELELTGEERAERFMMGKPDAYTVMKNRLVIAALQVFSGELVLQMDGCPVCVFSSVIDQAADGVSLERTKRS